MMRRDYSHLYPPLSQSPPVGSAVLLAIEVAALRADIKHLTNELSRRFSMLDADLKAAVDAITENTSAMQSLEGGVALVVKVLKEGHDPMILALQDQVQALKDKLNAGRVIAATDLAELQMKAGELRVSNRNLTEATAMLLSAIPANTMAPPPAPEPVLLDPPIDPPPAPEPEPAPVVVEQPVGIIVDPAVLEPPLMPPAPIEPQGDGPMGDQPPTAPLPIEAPPPPVEADMPIDHTPMDPLPEPVVDPLAPAPEPVEEVLPPEEPPAPAN